MQNVSADLAIAVNLQLLDNALSSHDYLTSLQQWGDGQLKLARPICSNNLPIGL
ncbi:hypothetical protein NC969_01010 [Leptolyngbya subtilissima ST-M1]|uniref:hypothetical protein n=1 Tax=Cyanophyceae TaxID=3028117 RepID=UPI001687E9D9|nr:hypothetical protein [Nodosilinea sp. FACHB-131]